jgi:hydrogenase maturation factor
MKLNSKDLQTLLGYIRKDRRVLVPPMIGYDAGVHQIDGKYLVVASDPCTGVPPEWFGYLLINYAASDVALFGAKPAFCTINLLGPKTAKPDAFQNIMQQTCQAADELDIAVVRGHTGMYDGVCEMLGVATVYGSVELERLITPANAQAGDLILCTKPVGMETIINFCLTHKDQAVHLFGETRQAALSGQVRMQSCVSEALKLAETGAVHAMHDATEGGLVTALNELAGASNLGFTVTWENLPFTKEAWVLQSHFKLADEQVLAMSSTGTILAAVKPQAKEQVAHALNQKGLTASFIGEFTGNKTRVLVKKGVKGVYPQAATDPYTPLILGTNATS